ncbi:MAG: SPOR domain-containing protein [Nitrospirae bacterium]|nr:SPOR domain-containing protein [Nitrospirota bacterium]
MDKDETHEGPDITAIDADDAEEYLQKLNEERAKKKKLLIIGVSAVFVLILVSVYLFSRGRVSQKKQEAVTVVEPKALDKALEEPQQTSLQEPVTRPETSKPTPAVEQKPTPEPAPAIEEAATEKPPIKPVVKPTPAPVHHKPSAGKEKSSEASASKAGATSGAKHQNIAPETKKAKATTEQTKAEKPVKHENTEGIYSIQLGSFKDPNNAKKFVENLKKEGYSAFVKDSMSKDVLWHKVYVGKYRKKEDATAVINKLKAGGKLEVILKKI